MNLKSFSSATLFYMFQCLQCLLPFSDQWLIKTSVRNLSESIIPCTLAIVIEYILVPAVVKIGCGEVARLRNSGLKYSSFTPSSILWHVALLKFWIVFWQICLKCFNWTEMSNLCEPWVEWRLAQGQSVNSMSYKCCHTVCKSSHPCTDNWFN